MHWVFEQGQLERSLKAYGERRFQEGVTTVQIQADAHAVRSFLASEEARKLTVRDLSDGPRPG